MNLTEEYIKRVETAAKAYNAENDMDKRAELGRQFDELCDPLSEGQARQVCKRLMRL